jgi:hypothetical protein
MYAHIPRGFHGFGRNGWDGPKLPNLKSGFLSPSTFLDRVRNQLIFAGLKT